MDERAVDAAIAEIDAAVGERTDVVVGFGQELFDALARRRLIRLELLDPSMPEGFPDPVPAYRGRAAVFDLSLPKTAYRIAEAGEDG